MKQKNQKSLPPHPDKPGVFHSPQTGKYIVRIPNQTKNKSIHPFISIGQYDTREQAELIYKQHC